MGNLNIEAWLDQNKVIKLGSILYQNTAKNVVFTVLDSDRNAVNVSSYAAKATIRKSANEITALTKTLSVQDGPNGKLLMALGINDITIQGKAIMELALYSGGDIAGAITDRVQFQISIVQSLI